MSRTDRAICEDDRDGFIQVIAKTNGTLLGATIVNGRAGETITEFIVALRQNMNVSDLAGAIHAYPTYSTAVQQLAAELAIERTLAGVSGKIIRGLPRSSVRRVMKKDADYVFYELTRSICPKCRKVIDAKVVLRDNKVYMRKRCPDCGPFEALVYADAQAYTTQARYNKPGTIPLAFSGEIRDGCPHDCGLCPDHQQHTCLGIIEVNSACNMDCPLCFSDAGPGFSLALEEVEQMLDDYVRTEGNPEVVQFSGGEPTIHPQIIDFVRAAKSRGIPFVMINTNGKRIARDDRFLEQLNEVRPSLYFQFDGFESETYRILRGEPGILEEKLRALDRLAQIGLNVTIVPAIERGVNEHEVGKIIEFAIRHPAIRGNQFPARFPRGTPHGARSDAAHDHPGYSATDRIADRGEIQSERLCPGPMLLSHLQLRDLCVHRRRPGDAAPENRECLRLPGLHYESRHAGLEPGNQGRAGRPLVLFVGGRLAEVRRATRFLLPGVRHS